MERKKLPEKISKLIFSRFFFWGAALLFAYLAKTSHAILDQGLLIPIFLILLVLIAVRIVFVVIVKLIICSKCAKFDTEDTEMPLIYKIITVACYFILIGLILTSTVLDVSSNARYNLEKNRLEMIRFTDQACYALFAYYSEHGAYPESLSQIANSKNLADSAKIRIDRGGDEIKFKYYRASGGKDFDFESSTGNFAGKISLSRNKNLDRPLIYVAGRLKNEKKIKYARAFDAGSRIEILTIGEPPQKYTEERCKYISELSKHIEKDYNFNERGKRIRVNRGR